MAELDELKKKFIVDQGTYQKEEIPKLAERIMKHCILMSDGKVHFKNKKLTDGEKLRLFLAARSIANVLDENIKAVVPIDEMVGLVSAKRDIVIARANDALHEGFAKSEGRGSYVVIPQLISEFLDTLEAKHKKVVE